MYYGIKHTARLRQEEKAVVMFDVKESATWVALNPLYAFLMATADGQTSRDDLMGVLVQGFDYPPEKAKKIFAAFWRLCGEYLDTARQPFNLKKKRYDPFDFLHKQDGIPSAWRLSAPIGISWLVTRRCPYDCVYCCIETVGANDYSRGELSTDEAMTFLNDCVDVGVADVTFHGGEPFLRPDLPDFIKILVENDIWVQTSTKMPLSRRIVEKIADAGLEQLQISIDSPIPEDADYLVGGLPNYLKKAFRNIELLRDHGVEPTANSVVTSRNVRELPRLIRMLADAGVRDISLATYIRSYHKHDDLLFPEMDDLERSHEAIMALDLPDDMEIDMFELQDPRDSALCEDEPSTCSGGRSGIVIGPDGDASICDRLLTFEGAIVGNVKQDSLMDIWYGKSLDRFINPKKELYEDTSCHSCGGFDGCTTRVRCHLRAMHIEGKLFASDYLCQGTEAPEVRFF